MSKANSSCVVPVGSGGVKMGGKMDSREAPGIAETGPSNSGGVGSPGVNLWEFFGTSGASPGVTVWVSGRASRIRMDWLMGNMSEYI